MTSELIRWAVMTVLAGLTLVFTIALANPDPASIALTGLAFGYFLAQTIHTFLWRRE